MYKSFVFFAGMLFLLAGIVSAQTIPLPPANLTGEAMMSNARLQWDGSAGAVGYKVYKAIDDLQFTAIALVKMTQFTDQYVPPGHVYHYFVTAVNSAGESEPSNDIVFVPSGPPPPQDWGWISGTVVDDSGGLPVQCVRLRFYRPDGFVYFREARTDTFGYYSMHIDTGAYLVYATKWTYVPEWYDNASLPQDATPVFVTEGDTTIANFGLTRLPQPPPPHLVTVSGTVTDSGTGTPVPDAYVAIMRTVRELNMVQNQEGYLYGNRSETFLLPEFGPLYGVLRVSRTDNGGKYSFLVADSLSYIVLAYKPGYVPEFYNNKATPYDADRIFVSGNTEGIDFDLVVNPATQNSVSGTVKNGEGDGVISKVILFHETFRGVFPVRWTITDTLGNYSFGYLYEGRYFVKAVPIPLYTPAWYDSDSCGVLHWLYAESFVVDGSITGIDVCVKPLFPGGFAGISGEVSENTGSEPVQGVTVYAVSVQSGLTAGYDITEDDGKFDIQNLPPGSYYVVVDKEGYNSSGSQVVDLNASNNFTADNVGIEVSGVTVGVGERPSNVPSGYRIEQNYPNPFNPETEIKFGIPYESVVKIDVYNVLGQHVVALFDGRLSAGTYSVTWTGRDDAGRYVGSGVYFYKISAGSDGNVVNFTDVKKMMVLK